VKFHTEDLLNPKLKQKEIDFKNEGGETYICGNPPYKGSRDQSTEQKEDLKLLFSHREKSWKTLDYVAGWFIKAVDYGMKTNASSAFVSTNSICQGQHVPILWPLILSTGHEIAFAHTNFKWANLASYNAGVTVVVIGISNRADNVRKLFSIQDGNKVIVKEVENISPYLVAGPNVIVSKLSKPMSDLKQMNYGNYPGDGKHLTLNSIEASELEKRQPDLKAIIRPLFGGQEFIKGLTRYCLWIDDDKLDLALSDPMVANRVNAVRETRLASKDKSLNKLATRPHQYRDRNIAKSHLILVPTVSSERRDYIPADIKSAESVTTNQVFALYDTPLWNMAIISSRIHLVWITTVCGQLETRLRYSNTMGWNTFPLPKLTEKNKADLSQCAEDILLAREKHFPATIAELYENMPNNLREAHERNDEVIERIYIGRRFRNDTERLEKLFDLYTKYSYSASSKSIERRKGKK